MKVFILALSMLLVASSALFAQQENSIQFDSTLAIKLGADDYGNCAYTFVMLSTGDTIVEDKVIRDSLFRSHMNNMSVMAEAGKLVLAGPFYTDNDEHFRGIFILNTTDSTEVAELLKGDLTIKHGILKAQMYPWYGSAALKLINEYHQKIQKTAF
ncbi:MAG: hypothetical protein PF694_05575 [Bacteroidetes bacterium]|jgi:uncharacterized protein YciI|nr:hypothetical protein [Bacteroidota bacterium]